MEQRIVDTINFENGDKLHLLADNMMISVGVTAGKWSNGFDKYNKEHLPSIFKRIHNCTFIPDFDISEPMVECPTCGHYGHPKELDMPYSSSEGGEACAECGSII